METILGKGLLLSGATALVSAGVVVLAKNDFMWGIICIVLGCGIYILREVLKAKGFPVGKEK